MDICGDEAGAVHVTDEIQCLSQLMPMVALLAGAVRSCMAHTASDVTQAVACTSRGSPRWTGLPG
jgi:hypothetical protein